MLEESLAGPGLVVFGMRAEEGVGPGANSVSVCILVS